MLGFGEIAARVATAIVEEAPPDDVLADSGRWEGAGGTFAEVRHLGLRPAFRYVPTGEVFRDPGHFVHLPTAVPRRLWAEVDADGDFRRFVPGVEQGFVFADDPSRFVTRAEAAGMVAGTEWPAIALAS